MATIEIQIPRRNDSVYDESTQFPMVVGGAIDADHLLVEAHEHGHDIQSHKVGDKALKNMVEIEPISTHIELPPDSNH